MTINLYSAIQNSSISVGDVVYASQNESTKNGIKYYGQNGSFPQKIGKITEIGSDYIKVQEGSSVPPVDAFLMFSKDNSVNEASLKGYYASITMKNESTDRVELFAVNAVVHESSK
tara:strand:- start:1251 stop:1598 length:348 start_codon:yes stop_codon:yes gene_type:complete